MELGDRTFPEPLTRSGGRVRRRRSVADRQQAAARLLFAAAEEGFDGDLDVDWDARPVDGTAWMPLRLTSIYGTRLWRKLSHEQRLDLARREFVNILMVAMNLNNAASLLTFRSITLENVLDDDRARFMLKVVNDRSRTVTLFSRLINHAGVNPYVRPGVSSRIARYVPMTPAGPTTPILTLLADEFIESVSTQIRLSDTEVQPHVRQLLAVIEPSRRRHIAFGWGELDDALGSGRLVWRRLQVELGALVIALIGPLLIDSRVYRDVGINRLRGLRAAYLSRQYRARLRLLLGPMVSAGIDSGHFHTPVIRAVLRAGRCWPDGTDAQFDETRDTSLRTATTQITTEPKVVEAGGRTERASR